MISLLVTGALGHIGSRLIRSLPAGVFSRVVLLDNFRTQRYPSLFNLPTGIPFQFIEADIMTAPLDEMLAGIDVVIHLAAITDAEGSAKIPAEVMNVNLGGTERVAAACAANGARLIFVSTTSVYGVQAEEVDETCPREDLRPQSPYAESKLEAEEMLARLGRENGLAFTVFRFGTIFGTSPGMRFHTAINKFVWQAVIGHPLTIWRLAMDQMRPYLDLDDAAAAFLFVIRENLFRGEIYNAVTVNATVRDVVAKLTARVPALKINYVDSPIMNQLSYTVSSSRMRGLGFHFTGDLDRGLDDSLRLLRGIRQS